MLYTAMSSKIKPRYLLHGHTYPMEETMVTQSGETEIIYIHQDTVVTLF
jgi:hypothetical protein